MRYHLRSPWIHLFTLVVTGATLINWCDQVAAHERANLVEDEQFQRIIEQRNQREADDMVRFADDFIQNRINGGRRANWRNGPLS